MDFDIKVSNIILVNIFGMKINFQQIFFNKIMLIWLKNLIQIFFVKSHEWNFSYEIEMVQSTHIWLNTSSNVVIIWNIFRIYLHFTI